MPRWELDDYRYSPVNEGTCLPWAPGIETAWARRAWAAIHEDSETAGNCDENCLEAAYFVALALYFDDLGILAWGEEPQCLPIDWTDNLEKNEIRLGIEAYKRNLVTDEEIATWDKEQLLHHSLECLGIALRDEIATAIIKGFGGKERLLHSFLALERARLRMNSDSPLHRASVAGLLTSARAWDRMIEDFGMGPDLEPFVNVALWAERNCPYLDGIRAQS